MSKPERAARLRSHCTHTVVWHPQVFRDPGQSTIEHRDLTRTYFGDAVDWLLTRQAHEAGIHQHGMLKHHSTYEVMRPQDVGLSRTNLVLGKHSGRHAFRERVQQLGFDVGDAELNQLFDEFKALADKKKELFDGDIEALVMRSDNDAAGRGHCSL